MTKTINMYGMAALVCMACLTGARAEPAERAPSAMKMKDLPAGRFSASLKKLPDPVKNQVLIKLAELDVPAADFESLRVHPRGGLHYECHFKHSAPANSSLSPAGLGDPVFDGAPVFAGPMSVANPPVWHSRPGSTNVLFLDFNGAVVTNTVWNSHPDYQEPIWDCRPYGLDADDAAFSVQEQRAMRIIWERVAEDYAPFDIDVTTEQPPEWNSRTGHVLITPDLDKNGVECPHFNAGGVAFLDVFGEPDYSYDSANESYSPAWVYNYGSVNAAESEAEAASHEMGHNLALSHDGTKKDSYYGGHENGSIGWGPIMGTGYDRDVSQWSKGDYSMSNNLEDDLLIISSRVGYRPDDVGDDAAAALLLGLNATGAVYQLGVIEQTFDLDVFKFTAESGTVEIAVSPYRDEGGATWGGNLDAVLELYDEFGALVESSNPTLETTGVLSAVVDNGTYYLHVRSTGVGDPTQKPTPTGYARYGSLGQYLITGTGRVNLDLDLDGIPNEWEIAYFGDVTNGLANEDSDLDGQINLYEFIAGSNPTNARSLFEIQSDSAASTGSAPFVVSWNAVEGRVYSVQASENIAVLPFSDLSGDLPYPANSYTTSVGAAEAGKFYRVDVRLEN